MDTENKTMGVDGNNEREEELAFQTENEQLLIRKENELNSLSRKRMFMENTLQELESTRERKDISVKEKQEVDEHYSRIKTEYEDLVSSQAALQAEINGLHYIIDHKKNFNKLRVFKNIRELLKIKNIKLGQLEKDAGTQPGYMSRLEREGNTSDPSIEFIVTAAKTLEVSLDTLINGSVGEVSPTEIYLLKFMSGLIDDTRDDTLNWKKESKALLENVYPSDFGCASHPLFSVQQSDPYEYRTSSIYYDSRFFPFDEIKVDGDCYVTELPGTETEAYLMKCRKEDADSFYELYLIKGGINPVCCSIQCCEEVADMMDSLYKEIGLASKHVHLDKNTQEIISQYLGVRTMIYGKEG